ncbi:FAD-dependent monooxygenase [Cumulibacter manganitolerans]|uniref:FAD-dependent monooxygenase n=1 Tax=Cumulibacter manganitolerans TaxID=1884992 RepID=UPI001295DF4B|nr:FAD-dependent monooxygenase [Cumulibacter manganitolerans]
MDIVIAGAGIGGLTAALSIDRQLPKARLAVLESTRELREVGVGLNLPPHATRELAELGLLGAIAEVAVPNEELGYFDDHGALIWSEPRGLVAGYHWPQYSIHRARLQSILVEAVRERCGADVIALDRAVDDISDLGDDRTRLRCGWRSSTGERGTIDADLLIGADGIRSRVRDAVVGPVPIRSSGRIIYRGTTDLTPFRGGRSMAIIGGDQTRIVVYPIGELTNWLLSVPMDRGEDQPGDWQVQADPASLEPVVRHWNFDWLDVPDLVARARAVYRYVNSDIDPLPRWHRGRAVLLGDAAHAMYPFGSNGASQAILDARELAHQLASVRDSRAAAARYDELRRDRVARVQLANRDQTGDIMTRVTKLIDAGRRDEAKRILQVQEESYKKVAGFDLHQVNDGDVAPGPERTTSRQSQQGSSA